MRQKVNVVCADCSKLFDIATYLIPRHESKYGGTLCRSCIQRRHYASGIRVSKMAEYNKAQKGKTLEERLGIQKATEVKQKLSEKFSGSLNPNYGGRYSKFEAAHEAKKGKTFEEYYGEERAKELKQKISRATSGANNPMYGRSPSKLSGSGLKGYYKSIFFRSYLELSYLIQLDKNNIKVESAETDNFRVTYKLNGIDKTYKPDFYLPETDEVIEIKWSRFAQTDTVKTQVQFAQKQFSNYKIITEYDIRLVSLEEIKTYIEQGILNIVRYSKYFKQLEG